MSFWCSRDECPHGTIENKCVTQHLTQFPTLSIFPSTILIDAKKTHIVRHSLFTFHFTSHLGDPTSFSFAPTDLSVFHKWIAIYWYARKRPSLAFRWLGWLYCISSNCDDGWFYYCHWEHIPTSMGTGVAILSTTRVELQKISGERERKKKHCRWILTHSIVIIIIFIRCPSRLKGQIYSDACIEANAINLEAKEKTCKSVCTLLVDGVIVSPLTIPCHKTRRTFSPSRRSW